MARLESLLMLLGGAAMVMRLRNRRRHVGAATCFESEGDRRQIDCGQRDMLAWLRASAGQWDNFGRLSINILVWQPRPRSIPRLGCGVMHNNSYFIHQHDFYLDISLFEHPQTNHSTMCEFAIDESPST